MKKVHSVIVYGPGVMGASMAQIFAQYGYNTTLLGRTEKSLEKAIRLIDINQKGMVNSGLITQEESDRIPADDVQSPERILLGKEDLATLLRRSDALLSPLERRIFAMSIGGKSGEEIAAALGKEAKSIHNALYRIRRKLSDLKAR